MFRSLRTQRQRPGPLGPVAADGQPESDRVEPGGKAALRIEAPLIGINNRDLRTFVTRLDTTLKLLPEIPADRVVVTDVTRGGQPKAKGASYAASPFGRR